MIVCVCNNISDREIRQAVDLGLSSMAELRRDPSGASDCEVQHLDGARIDHAYNSAKGMTGRLHYPGSFHLGVAYLMDGGGL